MSEDEEEPKPVDEAQGDEPVYEMLWDCKHCGATKLLGLSHRHCPQCGSPQNAEFRYFPAEEDKVAVADHEYAGADVVCRYCQTYNSKKAKHCKDCGGPLEEGSEAQTRADQVHEEGIYHGEDIKDAQRERRGEAPKKSVPPEKPASRAGWYLGAGAALLVIFALVASLWKREASFTVASKTWQRSVEVEQFGPVRESAWCDTLPKSTKVIKRYTATRSTEKVKVGEDCKTRKVDRGDGTFKEKQECSPKYKEKPIKDEKCDYTVNRWSVARTLKESGDASKPPTWPALNLSRENCQSKGCERQGERQQKYVVTFKNADKGDTGECTVPEGKWQEYKAGASFKAQVGVIGGWLDCSSL